MRQVVTSGDYTRNGVVKVGRRGNKEMGKVDLLTVQEMGRKNFENCLQFIFLHPRLKV
jgi:hypothetical protein